MSKDWELMREIIHWIDRAQALHADYKANRMESITFEHQRNALRDKIYKFVEDKERLKNEH